VPDGTTATDPTAQALASYAAKLSQSAQPGPTALATALNAVATAPIGATRTAAAWQAYLDSMSLRSQGEITRGQFANASALLRPILGSTIKGHGHPSGGGGNGND
jgi:subtilisin family serine protease